MRILRNCWLTAIVLAASIGAGAQEAATSIVRSRLALPRQARHVSPPAVIWLKPLQQPAASTAPPPGQFTLLQKNRMFAPHLLVIPVGSEVLFPNADPFFHNVFSLFDGKRFDLGLYEAGSTKGVRFSREGTSYIFCNIHPEMSAVVVALTTSFYAVADAKGSFELRNVPPGDYELHVWIEGVQQPALKELTRRVHLAAGTNDLGQLDIATIQQHPEDHLNKFGKPYDRDAKPTY
jgi:plastocyanin